MSPLTIPPASDSRIPPAAARFTCAILPSGMQSSNFGRVPRGTFLSEPSASHNQRRIERRAEPVRCRMRAAEIRVSGLMMRAAEIRVSGLEIRVSGLRVDAFGSLRKVALGTLRRYGESSARQDSSSFVVGGCSRNCFATLGRASLTRARLSSIPRMSPMDL